MVPPPPDWPEVESVKRYPEMDSILSSIDSLPSSGFGIPPAPASPVSPSLSPAPIPPADPPPVPPPYPGPRPRVLLSGTLISFFIKLLVSSASSIISLTSAVHLRIYRPVSSEVQLNKTDALLSVRVIVLFPSTSLFIIRPTLNDISVYDPVFSTYTVILISLPTGDTYGASIAVTTRSGIPPTITSFASILFIGSDSVTALFGESASTNR